MDVSSRRQVQTLDAETKLRIPKEAILAEGRKIQCLIGDGGEQAIRGGGGMEMSLTLK